MCEGVMNEISDIRKGTTAMIDGMCSTLKASTDTAVGAVQWCGRAVRKVAYTFLPKPVAGLVTRAIFAAPYAAAFMYLPNAVIVVSVVAYVILHAMHPSPFNERVYQDGYTGLAIRVGRDILYSAYSFAQTGMRHHVVDALVNLIVAYTVLGQATKYGPKNVHRDLRAEFSGEGLDIIADTTAEPGATAAIDDTADASEKTGRSRRKQKVHVEQTETKLSSKA